MKNPACRSSQQAGFRTFCLYQRGGQPFQNGHNLALWKMQPQNATVSGNQAFEISQRLGSFKDAEGHVIERNISDRVAGNLQKESIIRPALVDLSGGMQETRAESKSGRQTGLFGQEFPQNLHPAFVLFISGNKGIERNKVAALAR